MRRLIKFLLLFKTPKKQRLLGIFGTHWQWLPMPHVQDITKALAIIILPLLLRGNLSGLLSTAINPVTEFPQPERYATGRLSSIGYRSGVTLSPIMLMVCCPEDLGLVFVVSWLL